MDASLGAIFNFYVFSTGRRMFALRQVRARALNSGFAELVAHVDTAIDHDRGTRQLDARWEMARKAPKGPADVDVQGVDAVVDRTLTGLRDGAESVATIAKPGDGTAEKVSAFLREIFPSGLGAVTSMVYVEELAAAERIVERLQGDLAPMVAELQLTRHAERLAEVLEDYRAVLNAPRVESLDFGSVRAARAKGQELLLEAVAKIVGRYSSSSPADTAARATLLEPILAQDEAIRLYLRSRRAVEDVDPETGEVDPGAPPSGPVGP